MLAGTGGFAGWSKAGLQVYYGSSDGGDADHYSFEAFGIDPAEGAPVRLQLSRSAQDRTLATLPEEDTACWVFVTPVKTTKHLWIWAHPVASDDVLQMVRFQMYSLPSFYQNIEVPSRLCLDTTWAEPIVKLAIAIAPMGPAPAPATPKKQRKASGPAPSSSSSPCPSSSFKKHSVKKQTVKAASSSAGPVSVSSPTSSSSASSSPSSSVKKPKVTKPKVTKPKVKGASSSAGPVSPPAATVIVTEKALADDPDPSAYYAGDLIDLLHGTISQSNIQLAGRKERLSEWVHIKTLAGKELDTLALKLRIKEDQAVLLNSQLKTLEISDEIHHVQGEQCILNLSAASRWL